MAPAPRWGILPVCSALMMAFSTSCAAAFSPRKSSIIDAGVDGRQRVDDVLAGIFRRAAVDRLEHGDAVRVDIARGGDAHAALRHGAKVGDDVAEHVGGDNHVEPLRVFHHPHAAGIHVGMILLHVGVLLADFLEDALPEIMPVGEHVRFIHQRELLARAGHRQLVGIAHGALDAGAGVDGHLGGHFIRLPFMGEAAGADVHILGIFAHDDVIDIRRPFVLQRSIHVRIQLHRAQVDILIEAKAQSEQQLVLDNPRFHLGMAHCAEIDRVELLHNLHGVAGHHFAGRQVAVSAPIERFVIQMDIMFSCRDDRALSALRGSLPVRSHRPESPQSYKPSSFPPSAFTLWNDAGYIIRLRRNFVSRLASAESLKIGEADKVRRIRAPLHINEADCTLS